MSTDPWDQLAAHGVEFQRRFVADAQRLSDIMQGDGKLAEWTSNALSEIYDQYHREQQPEDESKLGQEGSRDSRGGEDGRPAEDTATGDPQ